MAARPYKAGIMDAEQKRRLIDALFDEPGKTRPAATPDELRAARILVETGSARVKKPDASVIWRRHSETLSKQGRQLIFPRWIIPGIAAAAAAITLVVVLLRPAARETAGQQVAVRGQTQTYREAAQVFIGQASAYAVRESGDTIEISAQSLEARIDFTATTETKSVLIKTPAATFRIVGTSIAISATPEKATLHVAEGKVQVESQGQARLVTQGQVWSYENGHEVQRAETATDRGHFIQLGQGKPVPEPRAEPAMKAVPAPAESRGAEHKAVPPVGPEKAPVKEPVPRAENTQPGSERGKSERTEKTAHREDRDGARSDRAAARAEREERRSEREARRSERQAAKAERHK